MGSSFAILSSLLTYFCLNLFPGAFLAEAVNVTIRGFLCAKEIERNKMTYLVSMIYVSLI